MLAILVEGPAVEPVGVADMRAHLRLDDDAEDGMLDRLIRSARLIVEAAAGRLLVAQHWRIVLDAWPDGRVVALPVSPLIAVDALRVVGANGQAVDYPAEAYRVERFADPPRLIAGSGIADPAPKCGGIVIDVSVGYGAAADDVPAPLRLALSHLVAAWFESRGDEVAAPAIPAAVQSLLAPYRRARL